MGSLQDKLDEILSLSWDEEDKKVMVGLMKNAIYYRRLIPKNLEKDIIKCIDICIREKQDLDNFRTRSIVGQCDVLSNNPSVSDGTLDI